MSDGRDLRYKVCFIDGLVYAAGGHNSKAEKFSNKDKRWSSLCEYPLSDHFDSWGCALTYLPRE